jgi:hypothetical protein
LEKSDFIYAPTVSMTLSNHNDEAQWLKFYHQEARVIIELKADGVDYTDADLSSVALQVYGYTNKVPVPTSSGCTWSGDATVGLITPNRVGNVFTVLLAPRDMVNGDAFLQVSKTNNGSGSLTTYKLPGEFDIESGHTYTFTATMTAGGVDVQLIGTDETTPPLVTDPNDGGDWNDGTAS